MPGNWFGKCTPSWPDVAPVSAAGRPILSQQLIIWFVDTGWIQLNSWVCAASATGTEKGEGRLSAAGGTVIVMTARAATMAERRRRAIIMGGERKGESP